MSVVRRRRRGDRFFPGTLFQDRHRRPQAAGEPEKREFDRLEKIWQFYQPSSCLSKKKRLFLLILQGKTPFFCFFKQKKRSKSTRQTYFLKMSQTSFI